jgi:hypothetical protein
MDNSCSAPVFIDATGWYSKAPSDGVDIQHRSSSGTFRMGMALIGGGCVAALCVMAMIALSPSLQSTSLPESFDSTNLFGVPASLRSAKTSRPGLPSLPMMASKLPGASPWKELALAGIEASSRCDRDISMNASPVKSVIARMSSEDKAVVEEASDAVETKAKTLQEALAEDLNRSKKNLGMRAQDLKAGQTAPMGFFDPFGFSAGIPEGRLLFYREVELKHGRVCMLASLGFLVAENFHPLFGGNIDVPSYIAFQETPLQTFWVAVLVAIAIPESKSIGTFDSPFKGSFSLNSSPDDYTWTMQKDRVPGDLGFDPLGLKPKDEEAFLEMQNKELNNGRLAMIAAAGMIAQELVTGRKLFD